MSELDPNGVEAAAVAMTGAPFPSKRSLAKASAAITAYLSAVSPLSDGDGWQPIETVPATDGLYQTWEPSVPPQSHPLRVAKYQRGKWISAYDVKFWRPLPAGPRDEVAHD